MVKEIAQAAVDGLKAQPALLAVVTVNLLSLLFFGYVLHEISDATARDNALIIELVKKCSVPS